MASANGSETLVKIDDVYASAVSAAMARIKQVGPTTSLVETLAQQGWNWDDSDANIVVSDSSETDAPCLHDDEEVYHAA
jgi:hypothetical protein